MSVNKDKELLFVSSVLPTKLWLQPEYSSYICSLSIIIINLMIIIRKWWCRDLVRTAECGVWPVISPGLTSDQSFEQQGFILLVVLQHPLKVFLFPLDGHLPAQFRFGPAGLSCSLRDYRDRDSQSRSPGTETLYAADVTSCSYLLTPGPSSCRSWAVSSASSRSSPVSPPAPWGPTNKTTTNQHDQPEQPDLESVCSVHQHILSPGCRWWAVWSPAGRCTPPEPRATGTRCSSGSPASSRCRLSAARSECAEPPVHLCAAWTETAAAPPAAWEAERSIIILCMFTNNIKTQTISLCTESWVTGLTRSPECDAALY